MKLKFVIFIFWLFSTKISVAQNIVTLDPNQIQMGPYIHQELSESFLKRVKATTDVFSKIDGMTYEKAVDLYKRDLEPEQNILPWEEMARVYKIYCASKCTTEQERKDVYRALLLRSMFSENEAMKRAQPKSLSLSEIQKVVKLYRLPATPIEVIR